jgi:soluble lytic murein transglycosylase-like protein
MTLILILLLISSCGTAQAAEVMEVPRGMGIHFVFVCREQNVPVRIAYRLVEYESGWDSRASNVNTNGSIDRGIMQLNSDSLDDFAVRYNTGKPVDPWQWRTSIAVGIKHLSVMYKATGSWYGAVAAYNMGLSKYRRYMAQNRRLPLSTQRELEYVFAIEEEPAHVLVMQWNK